MGLARLRFRHRALRGPKCRRRIRRAQRRPERSTILLLRGYAMTHARKFERVDYLLCLALWLGYVALLLSTVQNLGYARDEGFYFQAARSYEGWFQLLHTDLKRAFEPATVDRYWSAN